jgi:hypothetical protein
LPGVPKSDVVPDGRGPRRSGLSRLPGYVRYQPVLEPYGSIYTRIGPHVKRRARASPGSAFDLPRNSVPVAIEILETALPALRFDRRNERRDALLDAVRRGLAAHVRADPARRQEQECLFVGFVASCLAPHEGVERSFARSVDLEATGFIVCNAALPGRHGCDRAVWTNQVA